ncbi:4-(cytidine 5'-diphospho)-2-C-methyl-D-erythritol kinase [Tunicatimonas pelagia]|uniref:4-(cytidine 5'-diphospho)-2-C-methyl-D-erythritol kinase n=1 Tax=Tunicatimonas pelagia TaxID=931531 RepID=UPI002666FCD9|nr:4-(cytidine 5'-diphospho)-2-C-methyl-D-erythritol kinase [Tunicatimonas pelagia]WKN45134.1 4-(cytidine 5'-diphospho)-2-C-methyl-D-erythritol kinase [Tunicatimonas pelagia]
MVVFPNAKINLGLHVVSKREDGYHNIETCFVPIPLRDILEVIESKAFQFTTSGLSIPGKPEDNLCVRAYELLQTDFDLPPVQIHLHKIIPMGGGLGGGSSNASFLLRSLNELFSLSLTDDRLEGYASQLGSDCPFFIRNQPVLASGTGNEFQEISLDLSGKHIVLVFPDISVSTAEAYAKVVPRQVNPSMPSASLHELIKQSAEKWTDNLANDFEASVFARYPVLEDIKKQLYDAGAFYASMSGSGSTMYGLFPQAPDISDLSRTYSVWQSKL